MPYISKKKLKELDKNRGENNLGAKQIQEENKNIDLKELIGGMQSIVGAIKDISQRLSKIENEVSIPKEQPKEQIKAQITENSVLPVTIDCRDAVEKKLNKNFGIKVEPYEGATFKFTILVPREYSQLNDSEWAMANSKDERMRIITISEGINGVNQWIEKVYNNFNSEIRAKIQADKFNL